MSLLEKLYGPFFDLNNWAQVVTSGQDWLIILSLILIECLLSVDNAIVLATQARVLPTLREQEKALLYGLIGSYIFRFLIIGVGVYLIHIWEIKVIGALYLMYLVYKFFSSKLKKKGKDDKTKVKASGKQSRFWAVIMQIIIMDIVFSVDSVLASLAISTNPVIVLIGGLVGILAMRGIAVIIMNLMRKVPELEPMAYILIALIAVKLFLTIPMIDIEISSAVFGGFVVIMFMITFIIHFIRKGIKGDDSDGNDRN